MPKISVRLGCSFRWREVSVLITLNIEMVLKSVLDISVVWVADEYHLSISSHWASTPSVCNFSLDVYLHHVEQYR